MFSLSSCKLFSVGTLSTPSHCGYTFGRQVIKIKRARKREYISEYEHISPVVAMLAWLEKDLSPASDKDQK